MCNLHASLRHAERAYYFVDGGSRDNTFGFRARTRRARPRLPRDHLLRRRRRAGRHDAGAAAGPQGRTRDAAGSASHVRARLPRRHHPPGHPGNPGRDRPGRPAARAAARQDVRPDAPGANRGRPGLRLPPSAEDTLPVHHVDAAADLPGVPRRGGPEISFLSAGHGGQRAAPGRAGRRGARRALPGSRRLARSAGDAHGRRRRPVLARAEAGRASSRSRPPRRWSCSGSACRGCRAIRRQPESPRRASARGRS